MFVAEDVKEGLYEASSWFRAALDSTTPDAINQCFGSKLFTKRSTLTLMHP